MTQFWPHDYFALCYQQLYVYLRHMDAAIKDVNLCQREVELTVGKYSYEHALGVDITHFAAY